MFRNYILDRIKEASTWTSLLLLVEAAANIHASTDFNSAVTNTILAIISLGGVMVKEPWFTDLFDAWGRTGGGANEN